MNAGLIFSYVIAGFLMILIITVSVNINSSSSELTLQESQKRKISDVIEIIEYDIPKIGYNLNNRADTLLSSITSTSIEFYSNIDNSPNQSLELIKWEYSTDPITETENPNDYYLYRYINGVKSEISSGITSFTINFYKELGGSTPISLPLSAKTNKNSIDDIVQLEIIMNSESPVALRYRSNDSRRYLKSSWTKRFSPVNLRNN